MIQPPLSCDGPRFNRTQEKNHWFRPLIVLGFELRMTTFSNVSAFSHQPSDGWPGKTLSYLLTAWVLSGLCPLPLKFMPLTQAAEMSK
ncbi:MAG TPA: hypothetical protein DEP78_11100, partial [Verrucomicrobiales bacterium]|nr:hypothetical protein [Verrucomicrobiales bacterium]